VIVIVIVVLDCCDTLGLDIVQMFVFGLDEFPLFISSLLYSYITVSSAGRSENERLMGICALQYYLTQ